VSSIASLDQRKKNGPEKDLEEHLSVLDLIQPSSIHLVLSLNNNHVVVILILCWKRASLNLITSLSTNSSLLLEGRDMVMDQPIIIIFAVEWNKNNVDSRALIN